jgi:hypothetical protein
VRRRRTVALCAATVTAVAAAAGTAVIHSQDVRSAHHPIAAANPELLSGYSARLYTQTLAAIAKDADATDWAGTEHSTVLLVSRGTTVKHRMTSDVYGLGEPPTLRTVTHPSVPGATFDLYHPGGRSYDLALLGSAYRSLAPTPWVELPTSYSSGVDDCAYAGPRQQLCWAQTAVRSAAVDQQFHDVHYDPKTRQTELRALLRVRDLRGTGFLNLTPAALQPLPEAILNGPVKLTIAAVQDATGRFHVKGIAVVASASTGPDRLDIDSGYSWRPASKGGALLTDFPPLPLLYDVTQFLTPSGQQQFSDAYRRLSAQKTGQQ